MGQLVSKNFTSSHPCPCNVRNFDALFIEIETAPMQRNRAQAKAISQREALQARLMLAGAMLLLPAALLLLLISP